MTKFEIHYQSPLEEAVDTLHHLARHLGYHKKQLAISLATPLLVCGLLFIILESSMKYILIAIAFIASLLAILFTFRPLMMKQLQKSAVQFRGTDQPLDSVFILNENGIHFQQGGQQLKTNWTNITDIQENSQYIRIIASNPLVCILLPKNAIPANELDEWRTFIEQQRPVSWNK